MKYTIILLIFISSCTAEIKLIRPKPIYYTTDKKSIEYGTHIGYTEDKYIILTEQGWKMHLHDSLIIKEWETLQEKTLLGLVNTL